MALNEDKAIVSLADVKRYLDISGTDDDRLLDALALQASVWIRKEIGCDIVRAAYSLEPHDGDGGRFLFLDNWPIDSVERVSVGKDDAITVSYSGGGSHAMVAVTDTKVRLRAAVSGSWSNTDFVKSDHATVDSMATAISGESGFSASVVSSFSGWPSGDLLPAPAKDVSGANEQADLEVPDDCETDYEIWDADWGVLYSPIGWTRGRRNVFADYTGGWTRADIPEPIQSACLELASLLYNVSRKDPSLRSEKIGDYSYTMADRLDAVFSATGSSSTSNMIRAKIAPYRRLHLGGA